MNFSKLLSLLIHAILFSSVLGGNETDRLSLLAFKAKITQDPLGVFSSWNESIHFCHWHGVTCGRRHQRVTIIDLVSQQLAGTLSPQIGKFSFLRILNLRHNRFSHQLPPQLGDLFRLKTLDLSNNSISGEIPASIGNLSSLETFQLTRNNLQGSIPTTFGQLKSLKQLIIGANNLSGTIPQSIFNLSSIITFSLPVNQLNGSLPPDLGLAFPSLQNLNLVINQFTGPIPHTISNATSLFKIGISENNFHGKVPSLEGLGSLIRVGFFSNNLGSGRAGDMHFLSSLINCTGLEYLGLSDNNFGGVLPEFLSNFSAKLQRMTFARNQLRGSIPSGIGNLISLQALGMEGNQFSGIIPTSFGNLHKLSDMYLNNNNLSGSIPSSLGNLTSIGRLNLGFNNLEGIIPSSLGHLTTLISLDLSFNRLNGTIPKELLGVSSLSIDLDLSGNQLTGQIPFEVGKLVNLGILDLSKNNLSGDIPSTIGSCKTLETLYLQGNSLQGTIPSTFSDLTAVQRLDLSRNNLSGQIPLYLERFAIQKLNLSFNDFEGEVPIKGSFQNASAILITGNPKLCGGVPQLNLHACTSNESKKQRMSSQLKLIISLVGGLLGLILILPFLILNWLRRIRKVPISSIYRAFDSVVQVSYQQLLKATDGFSQANLIGVGSFGSVYKGHILGQDESEIAVAVKVINLQRKGASKSFMAECEALRNTRHRNLCKIITACSSIDFQGTDFKALVYEFMVNGSLEDCLHPISHVIEEAHEQRRYLSLVQRIHIAIGVASALDYLHNQCEVPIVHCDLKPSNILLDDEMTARVGDFGLARFLQETTHQISPNETSSIGVPGSIGYAAPEYGMGSEVSTFGDVYSYGILLLEMFTGKRPTDGMFSDGLNLHNLAKMALPERVEQVVDPILVQRNEKADECLISILGLGVRCSVESPAERMNINNVVAELLLLKDNLELAGKANYNKKESS